VTEVPTFTTITAPQPRQAGTNRPLIRPVAGGELVPYTRVSTLASYLDDGVGIRAWDNANVAIGVARHQDLQGLIAPLEYGDPDLERFIELARDRVGGNYKANLGTAAHRFMEPGANLEDCPDWLRPDVDSYYEALAARGITQLEAEQFVVCDSIPAVSEWEEIRAAGTFDRIVHVPALEAIGQNPRVTLDVKTGKFHYRALSVQLTCYSHGWRYDHTTETRTPLDVNTRWALCAHVPQGEGRTNLRWINLRRHGYRALRLALDLRQWRSDPMPRDGYDGGPFTEHERAWEAAMAGDPDLTAWELEDVLATAKDVETLRAVWKNNRELMTPRLRTIAEQRALILNPNALSANEKE